MSLRPEQSFFRRARFKLTLYYTTILLLFLAATGGLLYYRAYRSMVLELRTFLRDEAENLMAWVRSHEGDHAAIKMYMNVRGRGERYYKLNYRLLDREGKALAASSFFEEKLKAGLIAELSPEELARAQEGDRTEQYLVLSPEGSSMHLLMTRPIREEDRRVEYIVQILAYLDPIDKLARSFRHIIFTIVPPLILFAWFTGYALARKVLRPVTDMAHTARLITSARLDQRLERTKSGDEFDVLAATLNSMIERLEKSFELLRQFAGDAAHELRTPLTIMKGEAEIALRARDATAESHRATIESTVRECDRLVGIVESLLLIAQAEAGDIPVHLEPYRLDVLLRDLAETFQVLAEDGGLTLVAGEFPETTVDGDGMRLHELFANLLDNAVKYSVEGGQITIACERTEREALVHVTDTGEGIPESEHEKIFDRFYRVDQSRSRGTGGSGLGLSIARWIADAHRGRIDVQSAPGAGSTFTVVLPLHGVPPIEPPELPPEA